MRCGSSDVCAVSSGRRSMSAPRLAHSPVAKREKKTTSGGTAPAIAHSNRCESLVVSLELMHQRVNVLAEEGDPPRDDFLPPVRSPLGCVARGDQNEGEDQKCEQRRRNRQRQLSAAAKMGQERLSHMRRPMLVTT